MEKQYLKFRHPFTALVAGSTGSGKTFLVRKILSAWKATMHGIDDPVLRVIWCYGQWQPLYTHPIGSDVSVKYVEGLIDGDVLTQQRPHVVIVDDLMSELAGNKHLSALFTRGSHHLNVSVMFIVQNMFVRGTEMRNISLNAHYFVLMKNVRDKTQVQSLSRQLYPNKSTWFINVFDKATERPFGYLIVDLKPDTPEKVRVRTRVVPGEVVGNISYPFFAPIAYYK